MTESIMERNIGEYSKEAMVEYANEVNLERAIPDAYDGLKPVQRRILLTAHRSGLTHSAKHMKAVRLAGNVLAYHPHGDASAGGALVTMSQEWTNLLPTIDISGANGSISGTGAAALRYIEARMTSVGEMIVDSLDKHTVPEINNFDGTLTEPTVMPSRIPYALIGTTAGIGYAASSDAMGHNVIELLDAAKILAKRDIKYDELMTIVQGPDFATGGILMKDPDVIKQEMEFGSGSFIVRAKIDTNYEEKMLHVTEIPPVSIWDVLGSIDVLVNGDKKGRGIVPRYAKQFDDLIDDTGTDSSKKDKVDIKIYFKSDTSDHELDMFKQLLFDKTNLQIRISANNMFTAHGRLKRMGVKEVLQYWIEQRTLSLRKELEFDENKLDKDLLRTVAQLWTFDFVDEIVKLAKASTDRKSLAQQIYDLILPVHPEIEWEQADQISGMQLYRIGKGNHDALLAKKQDIEDHINRIKETLASDDSMSDYLVEDINKTIDMLQSDKSIPTDRRTAIEEFPQGVDTAPLFSIKAIIPAEETWLTVKADGNVIRSTHRVYENSIETALGWENGTFVRMHGKALTNDFLSMLTSDGKVMVRLIKDLPQGRPTDGTPTPMLRRDVPDFRAEDKIVSAYIANEQAFKSYILAVSSYGKMKLVEFGKTYPNTNTRRYLTRTTNFMGLKFGIEQGEEIVYTALVTPEQIEKGTLTITVNDTRRGHDGENITHEVPLNSISVQGANGKGAGKIRGFQTLVSAEVK